jgi:hypothetical protein
MKDTCKALFLHTGYRTAGTWLWSCFRQLDGVTGYYEPLHEMLDGIDTAILANSTSDSWKSGHPKMDLPYFAEFSDLIRPEGRGIEGYETDFAIDRFDAMDKETSDRIERYIRHLMAAAHANGRVPVFKFCRSLGRLDWFRTIFPDAVHVVVEKNPISHWQSCWQLFARHRNAHFVAVPFAVLSLNRDVPIVRRVMTALNIVLPEVTCSPETMTMASAIDVYKDHIAALPPLDSYRAFLAHWLLTSRHVAVHTHAIFDCDLASRSPAYLTAAEQWVHDLTGLQPSFGSMNADTAAGRDSGFDAIEGTQLHLDALALCRQLAAEGEVNADTLSLWTSKIAQATQVMTFGDDANWPQRSSAAHRSWRVVDIALIDGAGTESVLVSEVVTLRTALREAKQELSRIRRSPMWRVARSVQKLCGAKPY